MSELIDLKKQLRAMRKRAGLSQQDLADLLGVSRPLVTQWETGHAKMPWDKMQPTSRACGMAPVYWWIPAEKWSK